MTTTQKRTLLVAVAPDSVELMKVMLGTQHECRFVGTLSEAQAILHSVQIDLIFCGARFDDSRLLDFLQYCKASHTLASIPFLCARIRRGKLSFATYRDLLLASNALGATGFVDVEQMEREASDGDDLIRRFRQIIDDALKLKPI